MQCPKCKLYNPDEAMRCDCGYDFDAAKALQQAVPPAPPAPPTPAVPPASDEKLQKPSKAYMIAAWVFALLGGVVGMLLSYSIAYNKNEDGYKYDLASRKTGKVIFVVSIVMFILGLLLVTYLKNK